MLTDIRMGSAPLKVYNAEKFFAVVASQKARRLWDKREYVK